MEEKDTEQQENINNLSDEFDEEQWDKEMLYLNSGLKAVREIYEWMESLATAAVFVVIIFTFVLRIVGVSGESMFPTLHPKDRVVISHFLYKPKTGDIVVTTQPNSLPNTDPDAPLIKRVIATAGQTLNIDYNEQKVYIDGVVLDEPYINFEDPNPLMRPGYVEWVNYPYTIPEGFVFVMGDNRNNSADSRDSRVGIIDERYLLGKVIFRIIPLQRIGTVA